MSRKSSVFDMIGPSSSHTAGVVRIGRVARRIFGKDQPIMEANITFYNSFARTYEGHGSDRAIVGGIMDFKTDDERLKESLSIAEREGVPVVFKSIANASTFHPNTVKVELINKERKSIVFGESLGGGVINISIIDEFKANFSANHHTLILKVADEPGVIAFISSILAYEGCNIATMSVSRKGKNDLACHVIEMDSGITSITKDYIRHLRWCQELIYIPDIDF